MAFSPGDRSTPAPNPLYRNVLAQFEADLAKRLNVEQMFILVDGLLPFEACLYHQVLPLFVEGSRLNLGMVTPNDGAATDYVRRMISYVNYSLVTHKITSEALQAALSAYLNYVSMKRSQTSAPAAPEQKLHLPAASPDSSPWPIPASPIDQSDRQTFILDETSLRQEYEAIANLDAAADENRPTPESVPPETPSPATDSSSPPLPPQEPPSSSALPTGEDLTQIQPFPAPSPTSAAVASGGQSFAAPIPTLRLHTPHRHQPIEALAGQLAPPELIQELLARVLDSGIGRLYFERQKRNGRVLWSQNGVLQAVLDHLEPAYCQSLVDELKILVHVPLAHVETPQQAETERIYQGERLLLRCRFMRGAHGDEATLQVLRGAALKFYEQQQIARLENDALALAQELQRKLNEIRLRANLEPSLSTQSSLRALADLQQALNSISHQIQDLQAAQPPVDDTDGR